MEPAPEATAAGQRAEWFARLRRSLVVRLAVLVIIFAAVPAVLYEQFQAADEERQILILTAIREKGQVISKTLEPLLQRADSVPYFRLGEELSQFQTGTVNLKLLFRPTGAPEAGFFYVASAPPVTSDTLEAERRHLVDAGILDRVGRSCDGNLPLAMRVELPRGQTELLTSISPVRSSGGCWALVISSLLDELGDRTLGLPYWRSPEVQIAAAIYLALAAVVLLVFLDLWQSLVRFGSMARAIRRQQSAGRFTEHNNIPELQTVAAEFDSMVDTLRESAGALRRAAEDTAHAFKTPIGVIRQAVEPLRKRINGDERVAQSIEAIETALDRLDGLVVASRRLDRAAADLLDPPHDRIDMSSLLRALVENYRTALATPCPTLQPDIDGGILVVGGAELLETVAENLVDNALSFTPAGRTVRVALRRNRSTAILTVDDEGPGVAPEKLNMIFDRYYSDRSAAPGGPPKPGANFGVGLWIVRRNVEAMGGQVRASNRPGGGLRMEVVLRAA
jgi:two-component system, OmpR family, sensor histidine kinase ChvG